MSAPGGDHDAVHDVALDVETEDRLRGLFGIRGRLGDLDAARLAAASGLHLGLDDGHAAELLGGRAGLLGGVGDDSGEYRNTVLLENVTGLILEKIHAAASFVCAGVEGEGLSRCRDSSTSRYLDQENSTPRRSTALVEDGVMQPRDYRQYAAEGALIAGGGAAILLQLGDPVVGRGGRRAQRLLVRADAPAAAHPRATSTRSGSATRTRRPRPPASVNRAHAPVPGAFDPDHQLWVAATLYAVGTRMHTLLFGRMSAALADEVYARSEQLGTALQLPRGLLAGRPRRLRPVLEGCGGPTRGHRRGARRGPPAAESRPSRRSGCASPCRWAAS